MTNGEGKYYAGDAPPPDFVKQQAAAMGGMSAGSAAVKPTAPLFDELNKNLECKIDRLNSLGRNLMGKCDRMMGSLPVDPAADSCETPESAISRIHHTLDRMQVVIDRLEAEISRLDYLHRGLT